MIRSIYQKSLAVLLKKPIRLWGISLLSMLLMGIASAGFVGVPAVAWAIDYAFAVSMAMIFLNSYRTGLEPKTEYLFAAFKKEKFLHVVGGMAWADLWVFIWALIPIVGPIFAIIRSYEYRFVPYILMTREDVKATDARKISKQETMGYKSKMFWADVLIVVAVCVVNVVLGLFARIPYVGVLFGIVMVVFVLACALLSSLFYGIMHAAFYVEIKNGQSNSEQTPVQNAPAPVFPAAAPVEPTSVENAVVQEEPAAKQTPASEEVPATEEAPAVEEAPAPVTCPICGSEVSEGAKFCDHCGHKM